MSKSMSGWQTRIVWGPETNIGTAVAPSVLWNSTEADTLARGVENIDQRAVFTGARGPVTQQLRNGIYAPMGDLGAAPIYLDGSSTNFLKLSQCFFQNSARGTIDAGGVYSYTFTQLTAAPDLDALNGLTILRDIGLGSGQCPRFVGAVMSACEWSWDFGGAILVKPTIMAMSATMDGTAPGAIAPPTAGFLQAPNIAVTFNGTPIYPVGWSFKLDNGMVGVPGPSTEGFRGFSYGDASGVITLKTWRDEDFYAHFITPYSAETIGTLVITATVDTSYGSFAASGGPYTAIWTGYVRAAEEPSMALTRGEMVDTITLEATYDVYPSLVVYSLATDTL